MKQNPLMYAIIGDICGSVYERPLAKRQMEISRKDLDNLMKDGCKFTDDTVHTVAVADAIMECPENPDFAKHIRIWSKKYPNAGYGGRIRAWFTGKGPGDSFGNGAYMRISPVYWAYNDYWRKPMMIKSIACSHDNVLSYLFLDTLLEKSGDFPTPMDNQKKLVSGELSIDDYHNHYHFNSSCQGSVPESIYVARNSTSFGNCIRNAILLGGDTDTQAAIAGGIYGWITKEEIPEALYKWAWDKLPKDIQNVLNNFNNFLNNK